MKKYRWAEINAITLASTSEESSKICGFCLFPSLTNMLGRRKCSFIWISQFHFEILIGKVSVWIPNLFNSFIVGFQQYPIHCTPTFRFFKAIWCALIRKIIGLRIIRILWPEKFVYCLRSQSSVEPTDAHLHFHTLF